MRPLFLSLLIIGHVAVAQKKDTVFRFLDANLNLTNEKNAVFYGVSMKQDNHWLLFAIYSDTTPVVKAYFKDKQLTIRDSTYTIYFPKHKIARQEFYRDNKGSGIWQSWYENGHLKDSGEVQDNQMVGLWKSWYENGVLMNETKYAVAKEPSATKAVAEKLGLVYAAPREGKFTQWYTSGNMESTGTYASDVLDGECRWFYRNGVESSIEKYRNGKLADIRCFDSTGKEKEGPCVVSRAPMLKSGQGHLDYIYQNLIWPDEALKKGIEGEVKVKLRINKNGEMEILELESDKEILKKAVASLLNEMKEWEPAISHNRTIEQTISFSIPFYRSR